MMRAKSVLAPDLENGEKENPAEATAGLSESDQTGLSEFTGGEFVAAFRVIVQARMAVESVRDYALLVSSGRRTLESFYERDEMGYALQALAEAKTVYRQLYRSQIRIDFKKVFGVKKSDFEDAVLTLERFFGGE